MSTSHHSVSMCFCAAGASLPPRDSHVLSLRPFLITTSVCAFVSLAQASRLVTPTYNRHVHFSAAGAGLPPPDSHFLSLRPFLIVFICCCTAHDSHVLSLRPFLIVLSLVYFFQNSSMTLEKVSEPSEMVPK